jgi:hypothetical protein
MAVLVTFEALKRTDLDIFNHITSDTVVTRLWKPKAGDVYVFLANGKGML